MRIYVILTYFVYGVSCGISDFFSDIWNEVNNHISAHVKVKNGLLQGRPRYTSDEKLLYFSFEGVPYAKPPTGKLRFQAPQPVDAWPLIKLALQVGNECPQQKGLFITGDEDCLYLNIYTPQLPSKTSNSSSLPVMVWIHGGAFLFGSGNPTSFGPDYFIEKNVILITLNYRLGILGFLSTGDSIIPGNNGLKDQILALKWIKENIAAFGGNPNDITLFGESAGSVSVHYLILSPLTKGLFSAAICQSGTSLNEWTIQKNPRKNAMELGKMIGLSTSSSRLLKKHLQEIPVWKLLTYSHFNTISGFKSFSKLKFVPNVEPKSDDAIITSSPYDILQSGKYESVPLLLGYNSREFQFVSVAKPLLSFFIDSDFVVPSDLKLEKKDVAKLSKKIKTHYGIGSKNASTENLIDCLSDISFVYPIQKTAVLQSRNPSPVFLYIFSFEGTLGRLSTTLRLDPKSNQGVSHYDEVGYLFSSKEDHLQADEKSQLTRKRMVTLWTNFAKTKNPTPDKDSLLQNITWPNLDPSTKNVPYLDIGRDLRVVVNPKKHVIRFWDDIYSNYKRFNFSSTLYP